MSAGVTQVHYGERARLGMLLPSGNAAAEPEFAAMMPEGVSLHTTRLKLTGSSEKQLAAMADNVEQAAELMADAGVSLILFHCTAVTTAGEGADAALIDKIRRTTGIEATATSRGLLAALKALDARRIVLVSPYVDAINRREVAYLRGEGFEVLSEFGLGIDSPQDMIKVTPAEWQETVRKRAHKDADAYFISCTAIRSLEIIAALEQEMGKPVITSNQVAAWHSLRMMKVGSSYPRFGRLFETVS